MKAALLALLAALTDGEEIQTERLQLHILGPNGMRAGGTYETCAAVDVIERPGATVIVCRRPAPPDPEPMAPQNPLWTRWTCETVLAFLEGEGPRPRQDWGDGEWQGYYERVYAAMWATSRGCWR